MSRDFDDVAQQLRNWGRWGEDDARGTLNHIGPEALKRAASEVTSGKMFNLGLAFDRQGPQVQEITGRANPQIFAAALDRPLNTVNTRARYNDDVLIMPPQCATQWDALSHVHYDGEMYNGCKACDINATGTPRNGVEHLATPGIASRGVLLDIARLNGADMLPTAHKILPDELDRACEAAGVTVQPGDIVLIRTGHLRPFLQSKDRSGMAGMQPGLGMECAEWLHDKSVAAVAADNMAVEFLDVEALTGAMALPLHMLCLRDMGMPLGEMFNLEVLAEDCAKDGRASFLISAPPLGLTGAFGSPVNPIVLK